jgi:hypothetical protein
MGTTMLWCVLVACEADKSHTRAIIFIWDDFVQSVYINMMENEVIKI